LKQAADDLLQSGQETTTGFGSRLAPERATMREDEIRETQRALETAIHKKETAVKPFHHHPPPAFPL